MKVNRDLIQIQQLFEVKEQKYLQKILSLEKQVQNEQKISEQYKSKNKDLKVKLNKYQEEMKNFRNLFSDKLHEIKEQFEKQRLDLLEKLTMTNYEKNQEKQQKEKYKNLLEIFLNNFTKFIEKNLTKKQSTIESISQIEESNCSLNYINPILQNHMKTLKQTTQISNTYSLLL